MNKTNNNWQVKSLGEVADVIAGQSPPSSTYNYTQDGLPFFQGKVDFGITFPKVRVWCNDPVKIANPNDILISVRAPVGPTNICNVESCIGRGLSAIRSKENSFFKYVFYFLRSIEDRISDKGRGSTFSAITQNELRELKIPLPPLPIQKQIAEILEQADKAKQKRKEANKLTDKFLQSVFIEMFGDPIHNQKKYPIQELKTLSIDKINYGVVQPGEEVTDGVPIIRVGDFDGFNISKDNLKKISYEIESAYVRSRIIGDEVLIACVGSIGKVALVDPGLIGYNTVRAVARVRVNKNLERLYLAYYLSLPFIQEYFRRQTRTVSQPTLNIKQISETSVLLPPLALQQQFAELVNRTEALKEKQKRSEQELENLFQSLMQKAFKGELVS